LHFAKEWQLVRFPNSIHLHKESGSCTFLVISSLRCRACGTLSIPWTCFVLTCAGLPPIAGNASAVIHFVGNRVLLAVRTGADAPPHARLILAWCLGMPCHVFGRWRRIRKGLPVRVQATLAAAPELLVAHRSMQVLKTFGQHLCTRKRVLQRTGHAAGKHDHGGPVEHAAKRQVILSTVRIDATYRARCVFTPNVDVVIQKRPEEDRYTPSSHGVIESARCCGVPCWNNAKSAAQ
jgi:hypothetical protein